MPMYVPPYVVVCILPTNGYPYVYILYPSRRSLRINAFVAHWTCKCGPSYERLASCLVILLPRQGMYVYMCLFVSECGWGKGPFCFDFVFFLSKACAVHAASWRGGTHHVRSAAVQIRSARVIVPVPSIAPALPLRYSCG